MNELICVLISVIGCLCIKLYKVNGQKKRYYFSYQNCLLALAEENPKLKEYLEGKNE